MTTVSPPELFCPFPSEEHPCTRQLEEEALARWSGYLGVSARHALFRKLSEGQLPSLLGRCHPAACPERLRVAIDFLIWNFAWDDQLDVGDVPPEWVRAQNWQALAVLQGAVPPPDAPPLLWLLVDIRARLAAQQPRAWMERFVDACRDYFLGTWQEALVRGGRVCLDMTSYIDLRRLSVGTSMVFTQVEAIEGFLLPGEVLAHESLRRLLRTATDVIAWANDLFSLERDRQDAFHPNLVFSIQHERRLSPDEALAMAVRMHDAAVRCFLLRERALPSFGEHDAAVSRLVLGVRRWMRANLDWSRLTARYQEAGAQTGASRVA